MHQIVLPMVKIPRSLIQQIPIIHHLHLHQVYPSRLVCGMPMVSLAPQLKTFFNIANHSPFCSSLKPGCVLLVGLIPPGLNTTFMVLRCPTASVAPKVCLLWCLPVVQWPWYSSRFIPSMGWACGWVGLCDSSACICPPPCLMTRSLLYWFHSLRRTIRSFAVI
ncbi:hypothetical protein G6F56_013918 [Rhizopus delemar]|nr:hypothetical protein G6F56_013918 [Rhizopus delemar]